MKRKNIIPYNPVLKECARQLRESGTLSEVLLWRHLKSKQILGYDFDRQKPLNIFIVDFFCNELMLAIEIDGESHNFKIRRDVERQNIIEGFGVQFLRFTDEEVKQNIEGVLAVIERWIKENTTHPCTPPKRGLLNPTSPPKRGLLTQQQEKMNKGNIT